MPNRSLVLVLSFLLVPAPFLAQGNQKYSHPGTIIDAYQRNGIEAEGYAYSSQTPSGDSECPTYGQPLDAQKSSLPSGSFTFHIDTQNTSYLAVYCKQGYAPRTETINENVRNNTRMQPDPITLYPTSLPGVSAAKVATVAIATDLQAVHSHLTYYAKADTKAFTAAVQSYGFSDEDRQMIDTLVMQVPKPTPQEYLPEQKWREEQQTVDNPRVAFVAMSTDLNHARSDFRYYARADETGYREALASFPAELRKAIEKIRTRSKPYGVEQ